ncbi:MAG: dihydrofolate reductase family protein [Deltaproteobacteria bacterium]|nr:dihydrofolate reductase family protein [Deltaproteobacteria bacterium]
MRKLVVSEFVTLDGVMQAPGGKDEDLDGGFAHGGWVPELWHDGVGESFFALVQRVDTLLLGRRTYDGHAGAFENAPADDPFAQALNGLKKYVVSRTIIEPAWRNTTVIRDDVVGAVRALKSQEGKDILTDGSSQLVHALLAQDLVDELHLVTFPVIVGAGKRVFPEVAHATFALDQVRALSNGVVISHYTRSAR